MPTPRITAFAIAILIASNVAADERLAGIACRSVHLGYPAPEGIVFYNEVRVDRSAPGTYFMVCGWDGGYFGLQELADGKGLVLFSVWDSEKDDPKAQPESRRVKLVHQDEKVRVKRFGGEGSGGQSFFDYAWKPGQTYKFCVTAAHNGDRTEYAGHFFVPEENSWKHLVTFSTIAGGKALHGYYSFVEDFKRDRVSATKARSAHFGNGWIMATDGRGVPLQRARFTADANPATNIDAAVDGDAFRLATGGDTANAGTKLKGVIERPASATPPSLPPTTSKRKLP